MKLQDLNLGACDAWLMLGSVVEVFQLFNLSPHDPSHHWPAYPMITTPSGSHLITCLSVMHGCWRSENTMGKNDMLSIHLITSRLPSLKSNRAKSFQV